MDPKIKGVIGRRVLIAFEEYERLTQLEDAYWAEKAASAEVDRYVGSEKSIAFMMEKHA